MSFCRVSVSVVTSQLAQQAGGAAVIATSAPAQHQMSAAAPVLVQQQPQQPLHNNATAAAAVKVELVKPMPPQLQVMRVRRKTPDTNRRFGMMG